MLALSDAALKTVLSAAAALPVEQRGRLLLRLAERAQLQSRAAAQRVRLHRVRRAAGVTVACIHVSGAVLELLAASPLLS
jgi:hypothetical protein